MDGRQAIHCGESWGRLKHARDRVHRQGAGGHIAVDAACDGHRYRGIALDGYGIARLGRVYRHRKIEDDSRSAS